MPFSNTPVNDTYSTQKIKLPIGRGHRFPTSNGVGGSSGYLSCGMKNLVPIVDPSEENRIVATQRGAANGNLTILSGVTGISRGLYVWEKSLGTIYYFVVATDGTTSRVYTATSFTGPFTAVTTLTNNGTGVVRFAEFIDATNVKKLVLVDGVEGYIFTSNAAGTKIVDVDFPSPHVPFPVFLDGYLFLAKAGTGDIYNSDLNDPAAWTAGSFISSELYPDDVVALVKVNNYLLAIGTQGCEYFYDAANATASPLARQDGATLPFGTRVPDSIASTKDTIVMLGSTDDGGATFKVIEGLKHSDLKNSEVNLWSSVVTIPNRVRGMFLRNKGDLMYVFTRDNADQNTFSGTGYTLVYHMTHAMWTEFTTVTSLSVETQWPFFFSCPGRSDNYYTTTFIAGHYNGTVTIASYDTNTTFGSESSVGIPYSFITSSVDFGTLNQKTMSRVGFNYAEANEVSTKSLDYSDDAGYTWSTSRPFVGVGGNTGGYPFVYQLGSFRQRILRVTWKSTSFGYYKGLECSINKGQL